jgi:hypothetical protein
MSFLDWVPTLEEAVDWTICRAVGHTWVDEDEDDERRVCSSCGKKEKSRG